MEKIFSKVDPKVLLHIIHRVSDITAMRNDVVPTDQFLQMATLRLPKNHTFKPHKHIILEKTTNITQESWVVLRGRVKCIFYDLDDKIIAEPILEVGDCSITLHGGHNYMALDDDTLVYEYKTGPYFGQTLDKTFI
jgi:hypothetical protein